MISNIKINGLKSIDALEIKLNPFTMLTGMNSSGKSTVIQALLLAIQNINETHQSPLNGELTALGSFTDAANFRVNSKVIELEFEGNYKGKNGCLNIKIKEDEEKVVCLFECDNDEFKSYFFRDGHIRYISAHRLGAQDTYFKNYSYQNEMGSLSEFVMDFYEHNKNNVIEKSLMKDPDIGETLELHTNYWMEYIVNANISTEDIEGTDIVKARFNYTGNRSVRPKNIGSGLSYIVSIIISVLSSKSGDLLIIENPEIHLHPRAQSKLTELFAFAASKNIRFIIETHSDHIFNGIRKSIFKDIIKVSEVAVYFFELDSYQSVSTLVEFYENGNVVNHQNGLFDQFDDDLDELLELKSWS
ncbi:DUF3696 domain-containing protein [Paenibacillus sp. WLX2291]|uniref:DUF3696 domain-containing protein n=1 Tax=Paenibacillus sp. WLX2291 TaxID=3296934 RepID=UPI0039840FFE